VDVNGKTKYACRIIPQRGSWIEMILDNDDVMTVNIDRRKKMPVTILFRALGYSTDQEILSLFYDVATVDVKARNKDALIGAVLAKPVFNKDTGEIIVDANESLTEEKWQSVVDAKVGTVDVLHDVSGGENVVVRNTISVDPTKSEEEALFYMYATMRPGDPPNVETARNLIRRLFFDEKRYDLSMSDGTGSTRGSTWSTPRSSIR
jgi:DNA-directed RNA polymerase subunit beta